MGNMLDQYTIVPFSEENIAGIHAFFELEAGIYSFSLSTFKQVTIDDPDFDGSLSLCAVDTETGSIAGAFLIFTRRLRMAYKGRLMPAIRISYLTLFAVASGRRRAGLGSALLAELLGRAKRKGIKSVSLMAAMPNYLWPGLDPRYTPAVYFLEKNGFVKKPGERQNLIFPIPDGYPTPPETIGEYSIARATKDEMEPLKAHILATSDGVWHQEATFSFQNDPISTFIARDREGAIIGWACHSIGFPGSFGPTEVQHNLRGKGLGGALLRWCAWDIKQAGLDEMVIRWVDGDTVKFYSKAIGAHIGQFFWCMRKRLRRSLVDAVIGRFL
jgi:GNAT superfamily N-acetyltransferase